jgi:hypothetical protein
MSEGTTINEPVGEVVVYDAPDGGARVEVIVGDETVWLTQAQMVDLFGRDQSVIARHIGSVFTEGELPREGSMQILHGTSDGGRPATLYNLDVIISVGYRVKSRRGTQFRIWATNVLREQIPTVHPVAQLRSHNAARSTDPACSSCMLPGRRGWSGE